MNRIYNTSIWILTVFLFAYPFLIYPWGKDVYYANIKAFYLMVIILILILILSFYLATVNNLFKQTLKLMSVLEKIRSESILVAYLGLVLLSTLYSKYPSWIGVGTQHQGFLVLLSYVVLFWLSGRYLTRAHQWKILRTIQFSSFICAIYGILQHNHIALLYQDDLVQFFGGRSYSFFDNPDYFGSYIVLTFTISIISILIDRNLKRLLISFIIICTQFVALLDSGTRSALLGVLTASLTVLIYLLFWNRRLLLKGIVLVVVLLCEFILINRMSHSTVVNRIETVTHDTHEIISNQNSNSAGSSRWYIWKSSLPLIERYAWLGSGPNTFQKVYNSSTISGYKKNLANNPIYDENNDYLQIALTTGFPSLICFIGFLIWVIIKGVHYCKVLSTQQQILQVGHLAAIVGYLVQDGFNISVVSIAPYFWLLLGFLVQVPDLNRMEFVE